MELDEVIERFGDAVDRGLGTLLIGAGLSMGAGYPGWAELLRPHLDEFGLDPDYENLPEVAQWVVNRDGRSRLIDYVVGEFNSIEADPTYDHRLLAALPIDEMWTTNYDPLLEVAADGRVTIEHDDDYLGESGSRRIHKMHGSIPTGAAEPVGGIDGLVITSHDYDLYEYRWPRTWRLLQAQFLTRTFLILGFSLTDPNFDAVFRLVRVATPENHMSHFALLRRDESNVAAFDARLEDLERSGIYVATYEEHGDITEFLTRLVARARPSRLFVSGSHPGTREEAGGSPEEGVYPTPEKVDATISGVAVLLGSKLAAYGVKLAAGGILGAEVGYSMIRALGDGYDSNALWILRRTSDGELSTPPNSRRGTVVFIGSDPSELRDEVFKTVRALVVLHGAEGTRREIERAREARMGIVPLAITGGTAKELWDEMRTDLNAFNLGGRAIPGGIFDGLDSADPEIATNSALVLIRQAMFTDDTN